MAIKKKFNELEVLLREQLKDEGIRFIEEYVFHPERKWRLDFYFPNAGFPWGVEINGGGWNQGGHNRNALTMAKDYEKVNTAQEMGIKMLSYTGEMIKDLTAITQIIRILK
uniref:DUF559 domain-containing protein n=1 Tax=uncultured marine virus TaxID=186617 RepID=A0A0F7L7H9_9VIRU|nr:hypothetical protein [uncultured marine virus]